MNANSIIAHYVAEATAGKDVGPGSAPYAEAVKYLGEQVREAQGVLDYNTAKATKADRWVPANGGYETALTYRTGRRLLYCFNFAQERHAYLDLDRDIVLSDNEAFDALGVR